MVADIKSRMSLFVAGLARLSSKEVRAAMLISDMDISRLMGNMAQWGSKPLACAKYGRNHSGTCRAGSTGYFKCGQNGHFMRVYPKSKQGNGNGANRTQSSSIAPPERASPRGDTSGTGRGTNRLNRKKDTGMYQLPHNLNMKRKGTLH
ncbi:uncharacterized protein LOC125833545 [Solanum verrucosum]|uniref:uncharacterized protein LOC125833545 n=1 Tax=Solanum verrucosum TaxID=315347 RepID=UPI0020D0CCFA|nr:uncharacterized protein LOC125833545 [Solanum verrucosum]